MVGKSFSEKIPKHYGLGESLPEITRVLGVGHGKNVVLENEEEINFIIDFYLHEYLSQGQTMLERYRSDHSNFKLMEIAYFEAAKASYTSLFKIIDSNPKDSSLTMIDLLKPSEPPLSVLNINLCKTAKVDFVVFSRLLPYEKFNAFSGMIAVFNEGSDRSLLKRYKVMKKRIKSNRESVQRFVACFKINRVIGMTVFMD
jgi:hypothetical protein